MTSAKPTTSEPTQPDPSQVRPRRLMPERLAAVLQIVRVLLGYGRRLAETVEPRARHIQFATVAAAFGTEKLDTILRRIERGILRAIALERYLIERAAKGRDLAIAKRANGDFTDTDDAEQPSDTATQPATKAKPRRAKSEPKWRSQLDPDHPAAFWVYTMEEIETQVRHRPIGRTIVEICNDLGVVPEFCTYRFWTDIHDAVWCHGGSFTVWFEARKRRAKAFEKERDGRADAWDWDWRDMRTERLRRALGRLIGEIPPPDPPDLPLATVLP